jgi:hypothetical protein
MLNLLLSYCNLLLLYFLKQVLKIKLDFFFFFLRTEELVHRLGTGPLVRLNESVNRFRNDQPVQSEKYNSCSD